MKVEVTQLSVHGRFLPKSELKKQKVAVGQLIVREKPITVSGRRSTTASLVSDTDIRSGELLPELFDADLIWVEANLMRLHGMEQIDGQFLGQTWQVKVL